MADKPQYRVVAEGIDYPPHKRAEQGDVVDDIPAADIHWLVEQGHIEPLAGSYVPRPAEEPEIDEDEITEDDLADLGEVFDFEGGE